MSTILTAPSTALGIESLTLNVTHEIHVRATLLDAFTGV